MQPLPAHVGVSSIHANRTEVKNIKYKQPVTNIAIVQCDSCVNYSDMQARRRRVSVQGAPSSISHTNPNSPHSHAALKIKYCILA